MPIWASGCRSRAAVEKKKKITIRGRQNHGTFVFNSIVYFLLMYLIITYVDPGMESEHDFEGFIEYANRVRMNDAQFGRLKRIVDKHMLRKPLYVCTIKKSNVLKNKAKMVSTSLHTFFLRIL